MGALSEKLEALEAEIERLKANTPTPIDHAAEARWKDEQHAAAERRAAAYNPFTRDQLAEMQAACPDSVARDIVNDNRSNPAVPRSQAAMPASAARDHMAPGGGSGWMKETELKSPPGVSTLDHIMDHQDAVDRHELMLAEAKRLAMFKPAESK